MFFVFLSLFFMSFCLNVFVFLSLLFMSFCLKYVFMSKRNLGESHDLPRRTLKTFRI